MESSQTSPETKTGAGWEAPIDQLATRLMIEGMGPAILTDLQSIADGATKNGLPQLAARATALISALAGASEKNAESLLKEGVTELRSLLDRERNGTPAVVMPSYAALADDAELVADFLVEAREHLSQIEGQMLTLERDPSAMEVIHTVFRAFHTIKGLAGFLDFKVVQAVAHEVETLLDLARNLKLVVDSAIVDVVLESGDFLLSEMAAIERVLSSGVAAAPADNSALIARIRVLAIPDSAKPAAAIPAPAPVAAVEAPAAPAVEKQVAPAATTPAEPKPVEKAVEKPVVAPVVEQPLPKAKTIEAFPMEDEHPAKPVAAAPARAPEILKPVEAARAPEQKTPDASSVRVETAKLDYLMDMVGEMVIAQSLIRHNHLLLAQSDSRLIGDLSQLARVTAEVQRATMSMRMVQVGQMFQKIERVIRDLSRKAGKQVVLQTSGMDTEVDKTVAEELSDPLLHMVRNSVDHGIESAAERIAAGKSPSAQIKLSAYHQGGQVVIEISDDGRGLDPKKIRSKAEQKGLISPSAQLTDTEINQLIFEPGFSTAEKITDVSGRGVGMDVVRRNVEKLRGRIETHSTLGQGTTFLLKLPLTLAIIDGLVIEVGGAQYIIPLSVVREIFRPTEDCLFTVEGRDEMVLVREQLLPVVRLNSRLGIFCESKNPHEGLLVVIESETKRYCMLVDDLVGKQEVVIKALGETFADVSGVSGCAVLGDGRVGLILDTDGIYRGRRR
jgi:two-component system chemotaxis sensor kinase CheA